MRLTIHPSVPADLKTITREAVGFYLDCFASEVERELIEGVVVRFVEMKKDEKTTVALLDTIGVADDDFVTLPTRFSVKINDRYKDMKIGHYLATLFHELTHARQMVTGRLKYSVRGGWKWHGKRWVETSEYWLHPWEVEAQGTEVSAVQLFIKANPHLKIKSNRKVKYNGRAKSDWKPE